MLELKQISRIYKPKKGDAVTALNKIDLKFGKTGMVFILGKSGSGKSTLLNIIGGLDKYDEGDFIVKDKSTKNFKQSEFDSYRNTMIGFIFQEYNVLDEFSVAQNIALALELQGIKATNEKLNEILELVDLTGFGPRKPNELSGGQKQRVAIARALVKNPEIIMADEPTGALDSETGKQVLESLKKLSKSRLVIVVSHDREFATTYGDRIVEFKDGVIISDVTKYGDDSGSLDNNISFSNEGITITKGYELTSEDLKVINDYLASSNKDVFVTEVTKVESSNEFVKTNQNLIQSDNSSLNLIKSKLPFKSSLKIGASSLRHKTIRLIFSIILAYISFALFGLTDTLGSYKPNNVLYNSIIDSEINYVSINKMVKQGEGVGAYYDKMNLSASDITELNKLSATTKFIPVHSTNMYGYSFDNNLYDKQCSYNKI